MKVIIKDGDTEEQDRLTKEEKILRRKRNVIYKAERAQEKESRIGENYNKTSE